MNTRVWLTIALIAFISGCAQSEPDPAGTSTEPADFDKTSQPVARAESTSEGQTGAKPAAMPQDGAFDPSEPDVLVAPGADPGTHVAVPATGAATASPTSLDTDAQAASTPSISFPINPFGRARAAAERTQTMNNLKQIAIAVHVYHDMHGKLPVAGGDSESSWRKQLGEILEGNSDVFGKDGKARVMVFTGEGTLFDGKEHTLADVRDGASNTIFAVMAGTDKAVPWDEPKDLPFDPDAPKEALGEIPEDYLLAVFFDGSVQVLSKDIDPKVLKALITPAGGEEVGRDGL